MNLESEHLGHSILFGSDIGDMFLGSGEYLGIFFGSGEH